MTTAAPSWTDLYNEAKAQLVLQRPDLQVLDGDISDMVLAAISAVGDRVVGYAAQRIQATFVDGASGVDLTTLASDHWNITRTPAVAAIGTVTFTRPTSAAGAGTINAGSVVATQRDAFGNDVQFTTDAPINFGAGTLSATGAVTAVVGGTAGNVGSSTITRIITPQWDSTLYVTNPPPAITVGGSEEEADDALRERIRNFSTTLRRGTLGALEYGAKQVTTVKQATAVEGATGGVTVYVTDAAGASNAEMVSDVVVELENWRAGGALVSVTGGSLYTLNPITITLSVRTGVDVAAITADVKAAIVARVARLRIGETCAREIISQAALNVDPDNITGCNVVAPAADVDPADNQVIRTLAAYVTVA